MNIVLIGCYVAITVGSVVGLPYTDVHKRLQKKSGNLSVPTHIRHGTVTCTDVNCKVKCDDGFSPNKHQFHNKCMLSSDCIKQHAQCTAKHCGSPPSISHGSLDCSSHDHEYGSSCKLTCNEGHEPGHEHTTTHCQSSGKWSTLASCHAISCGKPPSTSHGSLDCSSHDHEYRSTCKLTCSKGYTASNSHTTTQCQSTGTWSSLASCDDIVCSEPQAVQHGSLKCSSHHIHKYGSSCTLTCDEGYKPSTSHTTSTCGATSQWSSLPSCNHIVCSEPQAVQHGSLKCSSHHIHKYDSTCTLTCDEGYKPRTSHTTSTCGATSQWSGLAACNLIMCSNPPSVQHGSYHCSSTPHTPHDKCTLQCTAGYKPLHGVSSITCQTSGTWTHHSSCVEKRCPRLPKIMNGKYYCPNNSQVHRQHEICDLYCDPGYKPDSRIVHTECSESETWTTSANCVEMKCQSPPHVENGYYSCVNSSHYGIGSTCELHCNQGYIPNSKNNHISCGISETWSQSSTCVVTTERQSTASSTAMKTPKATSTMATTLAQVKMSSFISTLSSTTSTDILIPTTSSKITKTPVATSTTSKTEGKVTMSSAPSRVTTTSSSPSTTSIGVTTRDAESTTGIMTDSTLGPTTTTPNLSTTRTSTTKTTTSVTNRIPSMLSTHEKQTTTPKVQSVGCEVCSGPLCGIIPNNDPLVTCPTDKPYCMNHVDNKADGTKTVTKTCASAVECNTKWWHETSDKSDCVDFNPKNIYSYYLSCYYCCTEDGCNRDVVPARKTLYIGHD